MYILYRIKTLSLFIKKTYNRIVFINRALIKSFKII
jgi:hypothetical protein